MQEGLWDNGSRYVSLRRPAGHGVSEAYFQRYSETEVGADTVEFQAEEGFYALDSGFLEAKGVPYLRIANVDIVPKDGKVKIGNGGDIGLLEDVVMYVDAQRRDHRLVEGRIQVHHSEKFTGRALYQYVNAAQDTFYIAFNHFDLLRDVKKRSEGRWAGTRVVSRGDILEEEGFKPSAGFYFKGEATMYSDVGTLSFDGQVKLALSGIEMEWIDYQTPAQGGAVVIDMEQVRSGFGDPPDIGFFYTEEGDFYPSFMQKRRSVSDRQIFSPKGFLYYDNTKDNFVVQEDFPEGQREEGEVVKEKVISEKESSDSLEEGGSYTGEAWYYSTRYQRLAFEGKVDLLGGDTNVDIGFSALGGGDFSAQTYGMRGLLAMHFPWRKKFTRMLAETLQGRWVLWVGRKIPSRKRQRR